MSLNQYRGKDIASKMHALVLLSSLLTLGAALPLESPVSIFQRATTPGTVYTKCSTPNTLALAYDDGPYQYTQSLVNTLNAAGAKGTFFFTGTLYGEINLNTSTGSCSILTIDAYLRLHLQSSRSSQGCLCGRASGRISYLDARSHRLNDSSTTHHRNDQERTSLC